MTKTVYKTECFYCVFDTAKGIQRRMQEILDRNIREGWRLHSWQIPGMTASLCVMVFFREEAQ